MHNTSILVVEDDPVLREAVCQTLKMAGYNGLAASDAESALAILEEQNVSLIISDVQMPGKSGEELLRIVKRNLPEIPFVLVTAYGSVSKAVEAMQAGAADYIIKPFEAEVLIEMVNRLALTSSNEGHMVVADPRSRKLAELSRRVAGTEVTVMISGESGSGKEVFARYLHECSPETICRFMPSTVRLFRNLCWNRFCSATRKERLPVPILPGPASSSRPMAVHYC